jgi:NADPH:quinone reductase-like Zn-dependent oxidoreductase
MRQVWITRTGRPEVMALRESDDPSPGPGAVRVRVTAAGVNFADVMIRLGLYPDAPGLPMVPGYEVAGVVDAVGEGVDGGRVGESVVAMCAFGGYADVVCVPSRHAYRVPAGLSAAAAAALPVNYLTAYQMLEVMAPPDEGETVLVHGAAGGVGLAAVQLARLRGARVLGSASPAKHTFLREQGVAFCLDSRQRDFAADVRAATGGRGVDVVLEPRHGRWIRESYDALAPAGRLVLFGFADAARSKRGGRLGALRTLAGVPWLGLNPIRLMNDNKGVLGVNLGHMWSEQERLAAWVNRLLDWADTDRIRPRVDRTFLLSDAAAAHHYLQDRRNRGKVLLVPEAAAAAGLVDPAPGDETA